MNKCNERRHGSKQVNKSASLKEMIKSLTFEIRNSHIPKWRFSFAWDNPKSSLFDTVSEIYLSEIVKTANGGNHTRKECATGFTMCIEWTFEIYIQSSHCFVVVVFFLYFWTDRSSFANRNGIRSPFFVNEKNTSNKWHRKNLPLIWNNIIVETYRDVVYFTFL